MPEKIPQLKPKNETRITTEMEKQLEALGFTPQEISTLTVQGAWAAINRKEQKKGAEKLKFITGENVKVRITNGDVEDNWQVEQYTVGGTGIVVSSYDKAGKKTLKTVPKKDLLDWQNLTPTPKAETKIFLETQKPKFPHGEKVWVLRGNVMEDGWEVMSRAKNDTSIVVINKKKNLNKTVTEKDLSDWQVFAQISEAKTDLPLDKKIEASVPGKEVRAEEIEASSPETKKPEFQIGKEVSVMIDIDNKVIEGGWKVLARDEKDHKKIVVRNEKKKLDKKVTEKDLSDWQAMARAKKEKIEKAETGVAQTAKAESGWDFADLPAPGKSVKVLKNRILEDGWQVVRYEPSSENVFLIRIDKETGKEIDASMVTQEKLMDWQKFTPTKAEAEKAEKLRKLEEIIATTTKRLAEIDIELAEIRTKKENVAEPVVVAPENLETETFSTAYIEKS